MRQLISARHLRPINEDRDHPDVARQGRLDLQPHKVIRIIKAPLPQLREVMPYDDVQLTALGRLCVDYLSADPASAADTVGVIMKRS
jgi:hypothetical protein